MEITFKEKKRIIQILADGKHVKSLPIELSFATNYVNENMIKNFSKGKTLSQNDRNLLSEFVFPIINFEWQEKLKKELLIIYKLISGKAVGLRRVNVRHLSDPRFEIQFEDKKVWFVCTKMMYDFCGDLILPTVNLNY